jgi:hypothetical protein
MLQHALRGCPSRAALGARRGDETIESGAPMQFITDRCTKAWTTDLRSKSCCSKRIGRGTFPQKLDRPVRCGRPQAPTERSHGADFPLLEAHTA